MISEAKYGVWPVVLTPFSENGEIDYSALEALIHWYEENGADGLFAVCQSSEMFALSLRERLELAAFVKKTARIPVIASGHISYSIEDQKDELARMADTGVDAVILITNRLAAQGDSPDVWKSNLELLMKAIPDTVPLGLYECPYPYKRLISDEELDFCAKTERFLFLKDTCCDISLIEKRLHITSGKKLRLFNANTATLLDSLKLGGAGFSGVMANFHPELYAWLLNNWRNQPQKAELLQAVLTLCSQIEKQLYPVNAKVYLEGEGVPIKSICRTKSHYDMLPLYKSEIEQMRRLTTWIKNELLCP